VATVRLQCRVGVRLLAVVGLRPSRAIREVMIGEGGAVEPGAPAWVSFETGVAGHTLPTDGHVDFASAIEAHLSYPWIRDWCHRRTAPRIGAKDEQIHA
jgi:hypothetical protein